MRLEDGSGVTFWINWIEKHDVLWIALIVVSVFSFLLSLRFTANARRWTRLQKQIQYGESNEFSRLRIEPSNVAPSKGWEKITDWFPVRWLIPLANFLGMLLFLFLMVLSFVRPWTWL